MAKLWKQQLFIQLEENLEDDNEEELLLQGVLEQLLKLRKTRGKGIVATKWDAQRTS